MQTAAPMVTRQHVLRRTTTAHERHTVLRGVDIDLVTVENGSGRSGPAVVTRNDMMGIEPRVGLDPKVAAERSTISSTLPPCRVRLTTVNLSSCPLRCPCFG